MDVLICPVCECEVFDKPCEHTVYLATNECGVIYVANSYREQFFQAVEAVLKAHGELDANQVLDESEFPFEYKDEFERFFQPEGIVHDIGFAQPPSGLTIFTGFIDRKVANC